MIQEQLDSIENKSELEAEPLNRSNTTQSSKETFKSKLKLNLEKVLVNDRITRPITTVEDLDRELAKTIPRSSRHPLMNDHGLIASRD